MSPRSRLSTSISLWKEEDLGAPKRKTIRTLEKDDGDEPTECEEDEEMFVFNEGEKASMKEVELACSGIVDSSMALEDCGCVTSRRPSLFEDGSL